MQLTLGTIRNTVKRQNPGCLQHLTTILLLWSLNRKEVCTQGAQQWSEDVNLIIEINRTHPQGKDRALQSRCSFSYTGLHVAASG